MANENPEGGLRRHRTEFVREDEFSVTPTSSPSYLKYSDTVTEFNWASDSVNEPRRGLGDADPTGFLKGPETHELTIVYDLVKWFTDGSSNPEDAAYDALQRDADNLLPNSHTIVDREEKMAVSAAQTVSGNTARDSRIYTVGKGGLVDEIEMTGDPSDSQPVTVELSYLVQKARSYQIDQPESSTLLAVKSSNANDTTQTLTIESEGGSTSEDVSLSGTSTVSTTSQFSDIDALYLSDDTEGDVTVSLNSGSQTSPTVGDSLAIIQGAESYNDVEGDLGVPPVGSGSHETLSNPSPEIFIGDVIANGSTPFPYEIPTATLNVANNIEETEVSSGYGMALHPANREITIELSMFGESATHHLLTQHLTNTAKDIDWTMTGGTMTLAGAVLQEPGERAAEEGQAALVADHTFQAKDITFS